MKQSPWQCKFASLARCASSRVQLLRFSIARTLGDVVQETLAMERYDIALRVLHACPCAGAKAEEPSRMHLVSGAVLSRQHADTYSCVAAPSWDKSSPPCVPLQGLP
jgi:hypothetical protein